MVAVFWSQVWGSEDDGAFLSGDFLGECWLPPLGSLTAASKRYVLPLTNAPPETGATRFLGAVER